MEVIFECPNCLDATFPPALQHLYLGRGVSEFKRVIEVLTPSYYSWASEYLEGLEPSPPAS